MIGERRRIQAAKDLRLMRLLNVAPSGDKSAYSDLQTELLEEANDRD